MTTTTTTTAGYVDVSDVFWELVDTVAKHPYEHVVEQHCYRVVASCVRASMPMALRRDCVVATVERVGDAVWVVYESSPPSRFWYDAKTDMWVFSDANVMFYVILHRMTWPPDDPRLTQLERCVRRMRDVVDVNDVGEALSTTLRVS